MMTKYMTSLTCAFNPLSPARSHKIPRLLLAHLGPNARNPTGGNMAIKTTILPSTSTAPAVLTVGLRDGKTLTWMEQREGQESQGWDLAKTTFKDVTDEIDRLSRVLRRKEELAG